LRRRGKGKRVPSNPAAKISSTLITSSTEKGTDIVRAFFSAVDHTEESCSCPRKARRKLLRRRGREKQFPENPAAKISSTLIKTRT